MNVMGTAACFLASGSGSQGAGVVGLNYPLDTISTYT
jgi:hypothetical protein